MRARRFRPRLDELEDRRLPTTYLVTTNADSGVDPLPGDGTGTLRQAIVDANDHPNSGGPDEIHFVLEPGLQTIVPLSALPPIAEAVIVDGRTNPGFAGSPIVELDGSSAGSSANGLVLLGTVGSQIRSLVIDRFAGGGGNSGNGIEIDGGSDNAIYGCYIGTDRSGLFARPNATGVHVVFSSHNVIGGSGAAEGNLISGNAGVGIAFANVGAGFVDNGVFGNLIGTDRSGDFALGNQVGISIFGSQ